MFSRLHPSRRRRYNNACMKHALRDNLTPRAILLNAHQPFTKERDVRLALQYAIDKEGIVQGILNGSL